MLKNRMIELSQFSARSNLIGSKLTAPLLPEVAEADDFQPVRRLITSIHKKTQQIDDLRLQFKKVANPKRQKQLNEKLNQIISQNKPTLKELQRTVKIINDKYVKTPDADGPKKAICQDLTIKAKEAVDKFRASEEKFSMEVRSTVKRQAVILQGDISEEEVDFIMANPDKGQQMLAAKLLNSPSVQLENAVSDILDKYRDIIKLQKDVHECMDLTQELALLVSYQGEQIDNIEVTLVSAKDYVDNGQKKLVEAKQHHKSAQKKIICILFLVLLAIGVIVIPIVITQTSK